MRGGRGALAALSLALAFLAVASPARQAQAVSGYLPGPGTVWAKLGYFRWHAEERWAGIFTPGARAGEGVAIDPGAETSAFDYWALTLDAQVVPLERLVVGLYVPIQQRLGLRRDGEELAEQGFGDVALYVGYQVTPRGLEVASSFFAHVRIPGAPVRLPGIPFPVSEGQVDLGIENVSTWSITRDLHLSGRLGYRIRLPSDRAAQLGDPGDETEVGLELGGAPARRLWLRAGWAALFGRAQRVDPAFYGGQSIFQREAHALEVGAYLQVGDWLSDSVAPLSVDAWYRQPIAGRDHPVGPSFGVGLSYYWSWLD